MVEARNGRGMASVNQTRPHCVNQMGKTHSKPLAAWHARGTAWARQAMCESALKSTTTLHLFHTFRFCVEIRTEREWTFDSDDNCPNLHQRTASPQPHNFCLPQVVRAVSLGYDLGYWYMTISDVR